MIEDREYLKRDLARIYTPNTSASTEAVFMANPQKTAEKPCKFQINILSLQRQSDMIGYPGRIPRGQDYTATAQFKSR